MPSFDDSSLIDGSGCEKEYSSSFACIFTQAKPFRDIQHQVDNNWELTLRVQASDKYQKCVHARTNDELKYTNSNLDEDFCNI